MNPMFAHLVATFQMGAWQALGKLKNPMTDRVERDLAAARSAIDLLEMLHQKTKGNLEPDEARLLEGALRDLRLNYVDEARKPESPSLAAVSPDPTDDPAAPLTDAIDPAPPVS